MKRILVAVATVAAFAIMGCGSSNPMVGTWKLQMSDEMKKNMPAGAKADVTIVFKDNSTFEASTDMMGMKSSAKGTYKLEDKKLTMTATEVDGQKKTDKPETVTLSDDKKSFDVPGGMGMKVVKQ
jgi:hypothetical protein